MAETFAVGMRRAQGGERGIEWELDYGTQRRTRAYKGIRDAFSSQPILVRTLLVATTCAAEASIFAFFRRILSCQLRLTELQDASEHSPSNEVADLASRGRSFRG